MSSTFDRTRTRTRLVLCAASFLLGLGSSSVSAEGFAVGARFGSPGFGVEATQELTPVLDVRGGANFFGYTHTGTQSDVDYSADLKLRSYSAILDLHPAGGFFHVSGGFFYDKNHIDAVSTSTTFVTVNGTVYPVIGLGALTGTVSLERKFAPYLGFGFGNAVGRGKHFSVVFDAGVMFQGSPSAVIQATGPLTLIPRVRSDLAQLQQDVNTDLQKNYFKYYPVVSLGITYQF